MNITELKKHMEQEIQGVSDKFSIYIETEEGNITIHENQKRGAASLIKVPILMEGFRQLDEGLINLDTLVSIDDSKKVGGCGVINYLSNSYTYSIRNLLELMIIVSDNTATNMLLDRLGIDKVNTLTSSLGCKETVIDRRLMDLHAKDAGLDNYTSAKDMALLLKIIFENKTFFSHQSRSHMLKILGNQQITHKLPLYHEEMDGIRFYHKTGELQGVEHDAAIIEAEGRTVYAAVLSEGIHPNAEALHHISNMGRLLMNYIKK